MATAQRRKASPALASWREHVEASLINGTPIPAISRQARNSAFHTEHIASRKEKMGVIEHTPDCVRYGCGVDEGTVTVVMCYCECGWVRLRHQSGGKKGWVTCWQRSPEAKEAT